MIARHHLPHEAIRVAVMTSLAFGAGDFLAQLCLDKEFMKKEGAQSFLVRVAVQIGAANQRADIAAALNAIEQASESEPKLGQVLFSSLAKSAADQGHRLTGASATSELGNVSKLLKSRLTTAKSEAMDSTLPAQQRADAIRSIRLDRLETALSMATDLLELRQPIVVQTAAVELLSHYDDVAAFQCLMDAWPGMSPALRDQTLEAASSRTSWINALLSQIEDGQIAVPELGTWRSRILLTIRDKDSLQRAKRLLATEIGEDRQAVIDDYREVVSQPGSVERGRGVFRKLCVVCHRLEQHGTELGPNLATLKNRGAETILTNLLAPNREVEPRFQTYVVETADGRVFTGAIAAETATSITLVREENKRTTILRANIESLHNTSLSLMPIGFEKQIDKPRHGRFDCVSAGGRIVEQLSQLFRSSSDCPTVSALIIVSAGAAECGTPRAPRWACKHGKSLRFTPSSITPFAELRACHPTASPKR